MTSHCVLTPLLIYCFILCNCLHDPPSGEHGWNQYAINDKKSSALYRMNHVIMHVCIYVCINVYMYACMYVCMYTCMYVCMHAYMRVCTYVYNMYDAYLYVCMYACMYACIYECMNVCMYVCIFACMYLCMHACIYACMYICMDVCTLFHHLKGIHVVYMFCQKSWWQYIVLLFKHIIVLSPKSAKYTKIKIVIINML